MKKSELFQLNLLLKITFSSETVTKSGCLNVVEGIYQNYTKVYF